LEDRALLHFDPRQLAALAAQLVAKPGEFLLLAQATEGKKKAVNPKIHRLM